MVICKMRRKTLNSLGVIALMTLVAGAQAQVTLTAKASFGGGDGWLTGAEAGATVLDSGNTNLTRGFAYDNATNQLIVVNRSGGVNLNLLNANTGALNGTMSNAGISGGTFAASTVGVSDDGKVYVANLASGQNSNFKIYEFGSATIGAAGSNVYSAVLPASGTPRLGDTLDVIGSGNSLRIIAGFGTGTGGYRQLDNTFAATDVNPAGTATGDFKFGISFGANSGDIFGTQGTTFRYIQAGVLVDSSPTPTGSSRPMDFAIVNGRALLAFIDTVDNGVRVLDMTDPFNPVFVAQGNNTTGAPIPNGNGVGQVKWGAINGGSAVLYALNTNNGIQAFDVNVDAVPEPATMIVLAGAAAIAARRRRKNS
ncbi:hypothetical protein C0431_14940 [bacterium]|nr:hypothetical protein [bacterium]